MIGAQLQRAMFAALTAGDVADGRIYDQVPEERVFPYVTIGDEQDIDDSSSCGAAWEIFADVHVWSRPDSGSKIEVKTIAASIVPLLATELQLDGFRVVEASLQNSSAFRDPDGLTEHARLTFRYLVDPT